MPSQVRLGQVRTECHKPSKSVKGIQLESMCVSRVLRCFKGVSRKFQGCFKEVSRVFQGNFIGVSTKSQGCFMEVSRKFQESFKQH